MINSCLLLALKKQLLAIEYSSLYSSFWVAANEQIYYYSLSNMRIESSKVWIG